MADRSAIEWTDATWNPIRARNRATGRVGWHCVHASAGCANCYAESWNMRLGTKLPYKPGHEPDIEIYLDEAALLQPLRWRRARKIFVGSMTDLFADFVTDAMLDPVFAVMALAPQHTFQVLTKRPARMRAYATSPDRVNAISAASDGFTDGRISHWNWNERDHQRKPPWPLPNVWLGTSCEDQATADARIPDLLATPAAVRFVSAEPLLGPIDFHEYLLGFAAGHPAACACGHGHGFTRCSNYGGISQRCHRCACSSFRKARFEPGLHLIIVGGESGRNARPMHPDWDRSIRDQCAAAGAAFFLKQWGEWLPYGANPDLNHWKNDSTIYGDGRVKRALGSFCASGPRGDLVRLHGPATLAFLAPAARRPNVDPIPTLKVGKRRAGRHLDGREHNDLPEAAHA